MCGIVGLFLKDGRQGGALAAPLAAHLKAEVDLIVRPTHAVLTLPETAKRVAPELDLLASGLLRPGLMPALHHWHH